MIENETELYIRINPVTNEKAKDILLGNLDEEKNPLCFSHPDSEIDIAVTPLALDLLKKSENLNCEYINLDAHAPTKEKMIELGISEGDFVYVLGFPMNLVDERNYVIARSGIIARIKTYLDGFSKDFLIDSSVFPGNSGGPVISKPENVGVRDTTISSKVWLLGMVRSYIPYRDVAIS